MSQKTIVIKLPPGQHGQLQQRLAEAGLSFQPVPHAKFSARGQGVVATLYKSGKLVVQGAEPELFTDRFLEGAPAPEAPRAKKEAEAIPRRACATLGSDECGKGDYFGPLVVVAVLLEEEDVAELTASGLAESKRIGDERALAMGAALRERYPYAVRRLDPPEYNRAHGELRNLNPLLARLHGEAIRELARPGLHVLVDQFGKEELVAGEVSDLDIDLEQRPRAEEHPAVAAASVIARQEFLEALAELSREAAVDLRKGAGTPVDRAGREYVSIHGEEALGRVAKLHFKNTTRVLA
ncbi:MAG: ribonuclease HIII [Planctomycetota bacterium]|nr:ribonuclease HIII [Planctomycetota bacterium]